MRPEGIHLTLRFLGDTSPTQVETLRPRLAAAAALCPPAEARVAGLGTFPERGSPRVLWLGLEVPPPLLDLQRACERAARAAGFEREERPFRAHLTLGRWRERAARPDLPPADLGRHARHAGPLPQRPAPGGAVYTAAASRSASMPPERPGTALRRVTMGWRRGGRMGPGARHGSTRGSAILPAPTNMLVLQVIAVAYLIGSLPFSFLVARAFGVHDVRQVGSGNVGATNVLRNAGKVAGALALLLDVGKGAAAAALAGRLAPGEAALPAVAAVAAVVGHMFPVWLRFHGGKGVATGLGAFAPLAPKAALAALVAFALVAAATRYVSLGSVAGGVALAAVAFALRGPDPVAIAAALTAALVVFRHRANLRRILGGTERRMGQPKE